ncbi:TM2 domain-containing protein [Ciceribacter ferrooxidans]|uniref:TM2 domain-containing protein n=1 Tax=Ciceribacter ferrooxidans TaxID=2509717 RepID=A0A4Q2T0E8_9HYPH|nr:NINE protein [Ciceribacter ferrooxidans]RYC10049.1 TM2 domain-containing protein [Ciceribacter ferrooxidans]
MSISTEKQILIEQRVTNEAKSLGVAYLLWFFLGSFGAHRFYLGRPLSAILILVLIYGGWFAMISKNHYGAFMLMAGVLFLLSDLFFIPSIASAWKNDVRKRLMAEAERTSA